MISLDEVIAQVQDARAVTAPFAARYEWTACPPAITPPAAPTQQRGAFSADAVLVKPPPQPPDGYFVFADFLCERVGLPRGSFSDYEGMRGALAGVKPGKRRWWHPSNPTKLVTPARPVKPVNERKPR
jgi:hypothetical protein